jgi:hypothetical protein
MVNVKQVVAAWARHGYRGAFARGCFVYNLTSLVTTLARMVQMVSV